MLGVESEGVKLIQQRCCIYMKRDNNRRPSGGGQGKRGPKTESGSYSRKKTTDTRFQKEDSGSKRPDRGDENPFFKKKNEGQRDSYSKSPKKENSTFGKFSKEDKPYGKSGDKKPYGKSSDRRDEESKSYHKKTDSRAADKPDDKRTFGRGEGKGYPKSNERKTSFDKPAFSKNSDDAKPEGKAVYRGRGKDEKPVFDWVPKESGSSDRPRKRKFKNPFEKDAPAERPEYNFERLEKNHNKQKNTDAIRLNKYISNSGICSRREADELITKGEIKVNGQVVTEMGYKVALTDRVTYKGKSINPEKPVYLLLNKPKDFITTTDDPMERKTVMHLVANACDERMFPVGRLDRNTTGLLLFTNDGELAAKLSHPSNQIKKIYQVTLDKPITKGDEEAILAGLMLEDGEVQVDDMQVLSKDRTILGLEIHVGKNRIVRRIFAHLGYEVVALDRVMYAGLDKKDLPRGRYRFLTEKEVIRLKFFI